MLNRKHQQFWYIVRMRELKQFDQGLLMGCVAFE
ncbi:hypothetical protein PANA5342_3910 [Pantoea ananatis LMG 5342]|nr:hypothetical protein PANA5342_3910 [Pantoea ananatis LMG 5342]